MEKGCIVTLAVVSERHRVPRPRVRMKAGAERSDVFFGNGGACLFF